MSLINKDSTKYDIKIKGAGSTSNTSINGNTTASGKLGSGNGKKVELNGQSLECDGRDIIIKDGKLSYK